MDKNQSNQKRKQKPDNPSSMASLFHYWHRHPEVLRNEYNVHANQLLSSGAIAVAIAAFAIFSSSKTGKHAFIFFSVSFVMAIIPLLTVMPEKLKYWIAKNSVRWLGSTMFIGAFGALLNICKIYEMELVPNSSGICTIIAASVSLPLFARLRHCVFYFVGMSLLPPFVLSVMGYEQKIPSIIVPFINGTMLGLVFMSYNVSRNYRAFYESHINKKYNKHLTSELQKAAYPHQLALLNDGVALDETMPVHPALGFACELDIIGSSRHRQNRFFEFHKQTAFKNAYYIIDKDYEINPTKSRQPYSNGFKLKEMGDGFIFTVNYPFLLKVQENIADQTVGLVEKMLDAANEAFARHDAPVHCAVSITHEQLLGFWTHGLAKVYDIDQGGITRSSRISSLRAEILEKDEKGHFKSGHLILISEAVYGMLSQENQDNFRPVRLSDLKTDTKGGFGKHETMIYVRRVPVGESAKESLPRAPLKIVS